MKPIEPSKTMMATKAWATINGGEHDIRSDYFDYCQVFYQDEENYYGHWITGHTDLQNRKVRFPKETTREMTPEESEKLERLDNHPMIRL